MKRIFLARHGQSEGNVSRAQYSKQNDQDIELTEQGKIDVAFAADRILELWNLQYSGEASWMPKDKFHCNIWHSPYKRAVQSSEIIQKRLKELEFNPINKVYENPLLIERKWGELNYIVERGEKTEEHFNFFYEPERGESFAQAYQRAVLFHQHMTMRSGYDNNVIVAHGEFNKLYMMYLLDWTIDEFNKWRNQRNSEVQMLWESGGRWELSSLTPLREKPIKH